MGFSSSSQKSDNTSQQTSQSYNQAYPGLSSQLSPVVGQTQTANNALMGMLGIGGQAANTQAFDDYRNSAGYDFTRKAGESGITSNNAAKGALGSGATLKALGSYDTNLASTFLDKYLAQLSGLSNTGIQAGQVLASAGNTANSQGTSYGTTTGKSSGIQVG